MGDQSDPGCLGFGRIGEREVEVSWSRERFGLLVPVPTYIHTRKHAHVDDIYTHTETCIRRYDMINTDIQLIFHYHTYSEAGKNLEKGLGEKFWKKLERRAECMSSMLKATLIYAAGRRCH